MQTNLLEKQLAGFQLPMINSIQASVTHSPSVFPNSLLMSGLSMPQGVFQDKPSFTGAAPLTVVPQNIVPQLIPSALNLLDLYNGSSKTFWSSSNVQQLPNKTIATPHQVGLSMSALDPSNLVSNKEICLSAVSRKRKSPDGNALTQTDVTDSESSSKFGEVSGKKKQKGDSVNAVLLLLAVQSYHRETQSFASPMEADIGAKTSRVKSRHGEEQAFVLPMVEAKGVLFQIAQNLHKVKRLYVKDMAVVEDVSFQLVRHLHEGRLTFVRPMGEEGGVRLRVATNRLEIIAVFASPMEVENVVFLIIALNLLLGARNSAPDINQIVKLTTVLCVNSK
eukprot:CAMPEP_0184038236 /NCGR_PEP_ID=MMETSP0955-20130417/45487_1 /TAXON_ID=627963 /ORGANISM="Aplanochytrium sp, Strain PBS07" /LENGTH=335 /DNA_ID=CAMNT_0026326763 /DNA_START=233 /DNA_END=1241 /DNA_ORIENTATION=+